MPNASASASLPPWFPGVWTREWIDRRGTRNDLFDVRFLQTPTLFADMRIPRDRPSFSHAKSFADLSDTDLLALAKQRGFTGSTTVAGDLATWHHEIDFQPPEGTPDIGRLERIDGARMYEHATDSSYTESWRSLSDGGRSFLVIRVEHLSRLDRTLLVAGDHFLYVRNRRTDLPAAESFDSLIASAHGERATIIEYLDCEFSAGRVRSGTVPWEIERSTLPWREGKHLGFVDSVMIDDAGSIVDRASSHDQWSVPVNTLTLAARIALFPPLR
ncbi:MAG: hypothetical protein ABI884_12885 [Gemmatimonadota bacterium]